MSAVGILADVVAGRSQYALVHADCLDPWRGLACLPDRSVHVCLTDPPYEAEAHELGKRQNPGLSGGGYGRDKGPVREVPRVVDEEFSFAPITEEQRTAIGMHAGRLAHRAVVFCQVEAAMLWRNALVAGGLPYRRVIPWVKPDAMPSLHGRWPGQSFESIVLAQEPGAVPPVGGKAVYYGHTRKQMAREERPHPTMKPLALMLDLVADFTDPGDIVIDPFMGSGTTGVACLRLGRRFIGWEMNADYYEIACRRLRGDEAKPQKHQPSLFDRPTEAA